MKAVPTAYFAHLAETSFPKLHGIDDPAARDLRLLKSRRVASRDLRMEWLVF
jgi:hypothetical protein